MRSLKKGLIGATFSSLLTAWAVLACTHDFEAYESGGESSSGAPGTDAQAVDGSKPGTDGSVTPTDGAIPKDGAPPPDCTTKASCKTTESSCSSTCEQTRNTCISGCSGGGSGNKCRNDCNDKRDTCNQGCDSTCRTCAGNGCTSVCN
jgi:hypothetical protein